MDIEEDLAAFDNDDSAYSIYKVDKNTFVIEGGKLFRLANVTDARNIEQIIRLQNIMTGMGVFDELKRIHDGLIKQEVDLNAYKDLSLEDVFFALKGQPESRFEEILKEKFGTSSPTANTALTSGLDLKTIEHVLNIILLLLTIYNQIQEANQPNLKPKEIAELAAKSAIETHQQIEQEQHQKQINPPRIHATPEHENECYCAHHHGSAIPQSQSRNAKRPIDNGENHISGNNRELLKDNRETQKKEEWV